ncbi:MAG TPA: complex I 30 kDa subunit family protein [Candidatus Azoamicus sp. MARI]
MLEYIKNIINNKFYNKITINLSLENELTLDVEKQILIDFCDIIKHDENLKFDGLMDISGVDYLDYGKSYWETINSTNTGFSRGHKSDINYSLYMKKRFCVSYHLLSYSKNARIRLRVFADLKNMCVPSVVNLWSTANWHEREVYDFFGIIFLGHPNLIRILTDYGFEGHPLRKDFPLTGKYEIRYDENKEKIIREASSIKRIINTPKIIRKDFRYKK